MREGVVHKALKGRKVWGTMAKENMIWKENMISIKTKKKLY